jgi:hypothetical protein
MSSDLSPSLPSSPLTSFEHKNRVRLETDLEHLIKAIACNSPYMIALTLTQMIQHCACAFGPQVYTLLGEGVIKQQRGASGFCVLCNSPNPVSSPEPAPVCPACYANADSQFDQILEELTT